MFFIGIFGISEKEQEIMRFSGIICPQCGKMSSAVMITHYRYFHLFFIPLFKWNRQYLITLRCCGAVYEADPEYARELMNGHAIDFSRLKKVSSGFGGFYQDTDTACPRCGRTFDKSFAYCPHCGHKNDAGR